MNKAHAALARTIGNIFQGLWSPQQRDWDPRAEVSGATDERTGTGSVPEQPLPSGYTGQLWWNPPPLALCERGISLHRHQPQCNQVLPKWFLVLQSPQPGWRRRLCRGTGRNNLSQRYVLSNNILAKGNSRKKETNLLCCFCFVLD